MKRWLDRNVEGSQAAPVYLSYFGAGSPDCYGIKAMPIPNFAVVEPSQFSDLQPGVYCISATMLQAIYIAPMGKWCRQYEDDYQAGLKWIKTVQMNAPALSRGTNGESVRDRVKRLEELRFVRLAAFLRHREPDDHVNHAILIYRLTDKDLDAALYGVPAELHARNEVKR